MTTATADLKKLDADHAADLKRIDAEHRAELWQQYRNALGQGDHDTRRKLMTELGITTEQAAEHLQAIDLADKYKRLAAVVDAEHARFEKAIEARKAFDEETKRIERERQDQRRPLDSSVNQATLDLDAARQAGRDLRELTARHRALFGLPELAPKSAEPFTSVSTEVVTPPSYRPGEEPIPLRPGENDPWPG